LQLSRFPTQARYVRRFKCINAGCEEATPQGLTGWLPFLTDTAVPSL
jgi:hypothetical protein